MEQIAGVCNEDGNVVGMMPHPERAAENLLNPIDNKLTFTNEEKDKEFIMDIEI